MGIDVCCVDESVSCSYTTWHKFRLSMAEAVLNYIKDLIERLGTEIKTIESQNTPDTHEIYYKNKMKKKLCKINDSIEANTSFDNYWDVYKQHWRVLKQHKISGIYSLLDAPDSGGVYTVGDAVDIIELIDTIRPYIPENTPFLRQIIEVFQESINAKTYITTN